MTSYSDQNHSLRYLTQRGAVVLMTATLLLLIATLTTLYTGRSQSFEHQIIVNNQNHKVAVIAAEAGLQKQLAILNVNTGIAPNNINETLLDDSRYSISSTSKIVDTIYGKRRLITINSTGTSADGLAQANVTETVMVYPILQNLPIAPLIVQEGLGSLGQFELVTNSDGKGSNLPLSIWSDSAVSLPSASSSSCKLIDYNNGECATKFISNSVTKGADVIENSSSFPANLFGYLFNLPIDAIAEFKTQANTVYANCDELTSQSLGLIWVVGDCHVGLGGQIGSVLTPLILIVEDGNVVFDKHVSMFGILLSFKSPNAAVNYSINMGIDSVIRGSVLANHQLGDINSMVRVVYEKSLLVKLTEQSELQGLARMPGSWRDF
ncbi:hypothetical protein [Paraglaciecola sp. L3A3]|uniref:hypothetical protein n=1 Tax=Paraglaciecola sp. L3A3 TaxID=2686358 RepID=UPI00131ABE3E|nr:hypothetical protein [Paraglaciecola sp. L3A3]